MTIENNINHSKAVSDWEAQNTKDLTPDQHVLLLEKALRTIETRTCETLSRVTLSAVTDRLLHLGQEKFPVLTEAKIDSLSFNFHDVHNSENYHADELIPALRFLLIELLSVLSRITANILAAPLHKALSDVTWHDPEEK